MIANYAHELRPEDYYMQNADTLEWDVEVKLEEGYPAGTAVLWRRSKWVTQPYIPGPDPDNPEEGETPEESVAGYQYVQASPDTIAVYSGEFEYTVTAIYQQWVHAEVWNETFQYWERPQPTTKYSQAFYDPNDPTRLMGVEYVADFTLGYQLRTVIDYNWFTGRVNKHTYSFYAPGVKKRIYTQLQIYDPNRFNMDLSDFDGPYEVIEQAGLTNVIYYPDGVTEDECLVDPYLGVDEQGSYIDVIGDGYTLQLYGGGINTVVDAGMIFAGGIDRFELRGYLHKDRGFVIGYDSNKTLTILENGPNRVVIRQQGFWDNDSGSSSDYLQDDLFQNVPFDIHYYVYDDFFIYDLLVESAGFVITRGLGNSYQFQFRGINTSSAVGIAGLTSEISGISNYDYSAENYGGSRQSNLNLILLDVFHQNVGGTAIFLPRVDTSSRVQIGYHGDESSLTAGSTLRVVGLVSIDSAFRENDGGTFKAWAAGTTYAKDEIVRNNNIRYISRQDGNIGNTPPATGGSSVWWLEYRIHLGIQYKDYTLTNLEDIVNDLNVPLSIDAGGFASDGAFHSEPRAADGKSVLTYDIDRIKPKHVLHEFPLQYGDPASPTELRIFTWNADSDTAQKDDGSPLVGTIIGSSFSYTPGIRGNCFNIPDRNTHIAFDVVSGDIIKTLGGTITCWFQKTVSATAYICGVGDSSDEIAIESNTPGLVRITGEINNTGLQTFLATSGSYDDGNWHFVKASWYDNSAGLTIFRLEVDNEVVTSSVNESWGDANFNGPLRIGARRNQASPWGGTIDEFRIYSQKIDPYGSIFTGNGVVDPAVAHADVTMHSVNGTSADIGGSITDIGNIDNQKGSVSLWCDAVTGDVWSAGTQFKVEYTGTVFRFTYGGSTVDLQAVSGTDHYVRAGWDENGQIYIEVDGTRNSGNAGVAPTLAGSITWNGTINRRKLYITSESGTPENWTASENSLHIPLVDAL